MIQRPEVWSSIENRAGNKARRVKIVIQKDRMPRLHALALHVLHDDDDDELLLLLLMMIIIINDNINLVTQKKISSDFRFFS